MKKNSVMPVSEARRIADQLHRAFHGTAWHGPALMELLENIDAESAAAPPNAKVHSIWELLLHIAAWDAAALTRVAGRKCQPTGLANFPRAPKPTAAAWRQAIAHARKTHEKLTKTVAGLSDEQLLGRVPGKRYNFYHMLHGIVQHELYHAGQIAILKKERLHQTRK